MDEGRRRTAAIIGVVVIGAAAVLAVFAMGVRHVPSYPSVADRPEPSVRGTLAYSTYEDRVGRCIWLQEVGGPRRKFACDQEVGGSPTAYVAWFGFDAQGQFVVARYPKTPSSTEAQLILTFYDSATLAELSSRPANQNEQRPDRTVRADGAEVAVEPMKRDGSWRVTVRQGATTRSLIKMTGPDDFWLNGAAWSTDGSYVVVNDSAGRYVVLTAVGEPQPRILIEDVFDLDWYQPG